MPANSAPSGNEGDRNHADNDLSSSPGSSGLRETTDSGSSDKLTRFILPSMDGSPPKVLTLNEVAHVVKNIQNMELAHEIALNPDFKLQPYEPSENSLGHRIKEIMHKAFWDVLREQLAQTPPVYDHAIQLLADIKECFPQIISSSNQRALEHINEVLDAGVIRQQAEKGVLDFKAYADFVIQIMAKSCAPARDEAVSKLSEIDDVVDTFKSILETMTLMKLDMANYLLDFARNAIMAHSVEYEKEKFKEYLEYYKFGFPATENWLQRNRTLHANNKPGSVDQAISNAYMELMAWDEEHDFPEVLSMDKERILKLGQRAKRLCTAAAIISICSGVPIISQRPENRLMLAKHIAILLQGATSDRQIGDIIENVWEQVKQVINDCLAKEEQPSMDEAAEDLLRTQILQVHSKNAPVYSLMWKRFHAYFRLTLRSKSGLPPPPPGYVDFKDDLESYAMSLKRVVAYNHSVFGDYFVQTLKQQRPATEAVTATATATAPAPGPGPVTVTLTADASIVAPAKAVSPET